MPRGRPKKQPSIAELQNMIKERRGQRSKLMRDRKAAAAKLEQIDRKIAALDGGEYAGPSGGTGSRPRNAQPLPEVMASVMKKNGKPMKIADITEAVQKAGYQSSSPNFRGIINQTLIKEDRFKQESRGLYKLA